MNDALAAQRAGLDPLALAGIASVRADLDAPDVTTALPSDHPAWQRDMLAVSARARALIAALKPIVVRALTFWDHHVREVAIGPRTLGLDASGSYRLR